jgi:hypothetical protein
MIVYVLCFILILLFSCGKPNSIINNKYNAKFLLYFLLITVTLLLSLNYGKYLEYGVPRKLVDIPIYNNWFKSISSLSIKETLSTSIYEPLFTILLWLLTRVSDSSYYLFGSIFILSSLILIKGLCNIFELWQVIFIYFTYTNYFLYYNLHGHIIRQGFAVACLVLSLSYIVTNKTKKFYIWAIIAPLFHVSAWPFSVVLFLIKQFRIGLRLALIVWVTSASLLITGLNKIIFGFIKYEPIVRYTSIDILKRYPKVNRIDFLVFSGFFLFLSTILLKYVVGSLSNYKLLLNTYILFNAIFLSFGFIGYSDRLACYSWYIIPLLIWYPILNPRFGYRPYLSFFMISIIFALGILTGIPKIYL